MSLKEKYNTLQQNSNYLQRSFEKMGNEITLKPVGYYRYSYQKDPKAKQNDNKIYIVLDVTNHGLSDQLVDDIGLRYQTKYFSTPAALNGAQKKSKSIQSLM